MRVSPIKQSAPTTSKRDNKNTSALAKKRKSVTKTTSKASDFANAKVQSKKPSL